MNYRSNKKRKIIFIVMLAVALTATIGYAVLNTVLKNNIVATISPVSWQVYMENASIYADTTANAAANTVSLSNTADTCIEYDATDNTICTKSVTLNANVKFDTLDKYVIIKFNATNGGSIPAIIDENGITVEGLGELITYSLKYSEEDTGVDVQPGDSLSAGATKPMYLKLKYSISDTATGLPTEEQSYNITINIKYIKGSLDDAGNTPVIPETPEVITGAQGVINKSLIGSSSEITSYTTVMTASDPSKLYLLESTKDDEHPIYFWRGTRAATANNFIFANMCWLGIRTTDTGGIKIIYNGVPVDGKCTATTGESTMIGKGYYNNVTDTAKYKDGDKDSTIKTAVDAWYEANLLARESYLEDTVFCNDLGTFDSSRRASIPSLSCSTEESYTIANGKLKYKVGLISADEAMFSGVVPGSGSSEPFLYNNQYYWTMTQGSAANIASDVSSSGGLGNLLNVSSIDNAVGYRPVVSLNADVTMTGTGTQDDPFVVKTTVATDVVAKSTIGSSSEITSYTTAMTASDPSKLYLLESTKDDEHPIYFWRGTRAATANNFIFANMCWLGIRTTDTGGIKIIYNGVPVDGKCTATTGESTTIGSGKYDSTSPYTAKYKDGTTDSDAKTAVETWYENNLLTTYHSYLEDTVYCNDLGSFYSSRRTGTPSLACSTEESYTVANGKLKYKVGLISADEAMFSGFVPYVDSSSNSTEPFLYNNQDCWTMTQGFGDDSAFGVNSQGTLYGDVNFTNLFHLAIGYRPVVSLNADVTMTGTGTQGDPFVVSME